MTRIQVSWRSIGWVFALSAVPLGITTFLRLGKGIPIRDLTRDLSAIAQLPPYIGFLSQVGLLVWAAAAAVCIFSASVLPRHLDPPLRRFLIVSAVITLMLGLDDAFRVHEDLLPSLGVPQNVVLLAYMGIVAVYLITFLRTILETEFVLLGMSLAFFAASASLDLMHVVFFSPYLLEDSAKLVGIVSWLVHFYRTGAAAIHRGGGRYSGR